MDGMIAPPALSSLNRPIIAAPRSRMIPAKLNCSADGAASHDAGSARPVAFAAAASEPQPGSGLMWEM